MNILSVLFFIIVALSASIQAQPQQVRCPGVCSFLYMPTCGFNGKCYREFPSPCALDVYNECENDGQAFRAVNNRKLCKDKKAQC